MRRRSLLAGIAALAALAAPARPAAVQDTALAYLVQTVTLRGATMRIDARHRPQRLTPSFSVTAVTRIEVPAGEAVRLSDGRVDELAYAIADTAELPGVRGVSIDFDVTIALRCFYRQLIHRVRDLLAPDTPLSITGVASWCMDDDWVSDLPIDEVVPMLRSAASWKSAAARVRTEGRLITGPCRGALGLAKETP